jgi:predicted Zn finger-like uncharacterized protein
VYTRCPQCQTIFRLTSAQLKVRNGQVRCGRCQHVFRADQHIVEPETVAKATPATRKRAPRKSGRTTKAPSPTPVPASETIVAETPVPSAFADTAPISEPPALLFRTEPVTRSIYWNAGIAALATLLLFQGVVFYGQELVRVAPPLREVVATLCTMVPCQRLAPIDLRQLDLVETQVTPHPRYDRALRIRATIVNRADVAQPYPMIEVSLTNSQGQLVARRTYKPREYLRHPDAATAGLPPQVAVQAQLEITSPGPQASGFEVLLVPPTE